MYLSKSHIFSHKLSHPRILTRLSLLRKTMSLAPGSSIDPPTPKFPTPTPSESLKLAQKYRDLAKETSHRVGMVKDKSCMSALILFLDDGGDKTVVHMSLETLYLLSQNPTNKKAMKLHDNLVFSLKDVMHSPTSSHDTQQMVQQVLDSINFHARTSLRRRSSYGGGSFISQNSRARTVVLLITALDEKNRAQVERLLLDLKGIISFTFNMAQQRCRIRVMEMLSAKELCICLQKNLGLETQQVVKNEEGEILLSYVTSHDKSVKSDVIMPEYIQDDFNEIDHPVISNNVLARVNDEGEQPSFWGKVTTFISNSLYW